MSAHESIGARLKREREKKSFSVEDVHLRLRIHPTVVQKLEADNLSEWPGGKIYARGFLKQYADFLGLNTAEVLSEFDSLGIADRPVELFVGLEKAKTEAPPPDTTRAPKKPRVEKKKDSAGVSPLRIQSSSQPDLVRNLSASSPGSSSHPAAKLVIAAMALVVVGLAVLQVSRGIRDWAEKKPSLKLAVMAPVEKKSATTKPSSVATSTAHATPTASAAAPSGFINSPTQGTYPRIRPQDRLMLEVNAITDVWMRIQADGNVVFEAILHRGDTERWLADKAFIVKLGRPEGVRIAVNGYPVGQPGAGKIKNLRFTRDGIEEIKG